MADPRITAQDYALGIDMGSASLGWAAVALNQIGMPTALLRAGVRIFEPAVSGDIDKGQDESNAVARRAARLIRRQLRRRTARQRELFQLLQRHGLLPLYDGTEADASQQRHSILNTLDLELEGKWTKSDSARGRTAVDLPLYLLRKTALDVPLEPLELGRIFYHLSQRRGYRSNRKEQADKKNTAGKGKKAEDLGAVEGGIKGLLDEMRRADARTLGEYFASLDPHTQKVRRRWTARNMYEDEFAAIWEKQVPFHPALLTEDLHREINRLLFYQRDVRAQAHLIGGCELEERESRAAWATLEAQQFRVLQKVNDLELILPGQTTGIPLTPDQRQTVLGLLENSAETTFKKIRKALGLADNVGFNLQRGGETKLKGNLTNMHMAEVFAERWPNMSDEEKKQVVEDWRTIPQDDSLIRRAIEHWKLDETGAKWMASRPAPSGYCMYSRKAIRKLLPLMATGVRLSAAQNEIPEYRDRLVGGQVYDRIPPVRETLRTLRNPAIERALTELRKVVNALLREHGRPAEVRIELARDLKKPRHERAQMTKRSRDREKERDAMRKRITAEFGEGFRPSRADVEKALLFEECGGECPYTGKRFPFSSLFGETSPWQVEHIIPFSRMPDDSFQNKTLCYVEENQYKANRTPFEAYKDPTQYDAILNRVRNWKKPNLGKLKRFELRTIEELEGFSSRQLNDTRYASKLACELLGTLYGGRDIKTENGTRQVVFASSGMVTATLRRGWGLEAILREAAPSANGLNKGKPRTDHRHHAIDAITIALSRPKMIAALSRANAQEPSWPHNGRTAPRIQAPWKDFVDSIRPHFEQMLVSYRPEHRLTGALHDETNYGKPHKEGGKDVVHIRKPVAGKNKGEGLSAADIENIVDSAVRDAVREMATRFGGDLKNWSPNEAQDDWPQLRTKTGKLVPIKRVRIRKAVKVFPVGNATHRRRYVAPGADSIHHIAVFVTKDLRGRDKWISDIVSIFEIKQRWAAWKKSGKPPLPLVYGRHSEDENAEFLFYLMKKDTLEIEVEGKRAVYQVTSFESDGRINLIPITASGKREDQKESKLVLRETLSSLCKRVPQKVIIDSIGRKWSVRDRVAQRP
jgi:CRISPR-associated endonuclease Csn1